MKPTQKKPTKAEALGQINRPPQGNPGAPNKPGMQGKPGAPKGKLVKTEKPTGLIGVIKSIDPVMIAAGGLGEIVLKGITQMKIGLGFEGGIAVVILAIILDRITQGMAGRKNKN